MGASGRGGYGLGFSPSGVDKGEGVGRGWAGLAARWPAGPRPSEGGGLLFPFDVFLLFFSVLF